MSKGPMKINGLPVVDAKGPVTIKITNTDVKNGNNKDPASCAAARALCRKQGIAEARVHIGRTYVRIGRKWIRYYTTPALRSEIVSFDRGGSFEPGIYKLRPLAPSDRASGKRQGSAKAVPSKNPKKRQAYHWVRGVRQWGANR